MLQSGEYTHFTNSARIAIAYMRQPKNLLLAFAKLSVHWD